MISKRKIAKRDLKTLLVIVYCEIRWWVRWILMKLNIKYNESKNCDWIRHPFRPYNFWRALQPDGSFTFGFEIIDKLE